MMTHVTHATATHAPMDPCKPSTHATHAIKNLTHATHVPMDPRNPRYHATHAIQQTLDILLLSSASLSETDLKDLFKVVLSCLSQFLVNETSSKL